MGRSRLVTSRHNSKRETPRNYFQVTIMCVEAHNQLVLLINTGQEALKTPQSLPTDPVPSRTVRNAETTSPVVPLVSHYRTWELIRENNWSANSEVVQGIRVALSSMQWYRWHLLFPCHFPHRCHLQSPACRRLLHPVLHQKNYSKESELLPQFPGPLIRPPLSNPLMTGKMYSSCSLRDSQGNRTFSFLHAHNTSQAWTCSDSRH